MRFLPVHPVAMRTTFSTCVLVNFAVSPSALRRLLPTHLEPDIYRNQAYVSIVMARMEKMRPACLPRFCGVTYHQIVYRAVVKCGSERGVTFLRSDADSSPMVAAGNALTFFKFHKADVTWAETAASLRVCVEPVGHAGANIDATYELSRDNILPQSTRFPDVRTAQEFLSELYVAFGAQRRDGRIEVVRIARNPWESTVVADQGGTYAAMSSGNLFGKDEASLDSIFVVRNLRYLWGSLSLERPAA